MDRRGFLQGVFGGVAASGLIVSATMQEIKAFAAPLRTGDPVVLDGAVSRAGASAGQHLYNEHGELVAIVTRISNFGDANQFRIEATGMGVVNISRDAVRIRRDA